MASDSEISEARSVETGLAARLAAAIRGDVEFTTTTRGAYTVDASNYRHVPMGVVYPADAEDVATVLAICREWGVALTSRGAGTSIAGNSTGEGVVLDYSRYMNAILELDPEASTARVQPGVICDQLRKAAAPYGLTFGPDPSTHSRCTIGGMIGNDSCGSHSVAWGKTSDNVVELDVLLADGTRMTVGPASPERRQQLAAAPGSPGRLYAGLSDLVDANLAQLRQGFPQLPRRVSGYSLDRLLPENGFNLATALVGTEGSCVIVLSATVGLVQAPARRALVVAGFDDDAAAADAVPRLLPMGPLTMEGMGQALIDALLVRGRRPEALDLLPAGQGWLFMEVGGADEDQASARAEELAAAVRSETGAQVTLATDQPQQRQLWSIREAASGIVTRMPDGSEGWPGWEDSAVPPERLGDYLRAFKQLLADHGLYGVPYGHFGEGCVHIRIDFGLTTQQGRQRFRAFMTDAADLVVAHGGSLSGEHGDGQARAELLPRMYSPEIIDLFGQVKGLFDPHNRLNPGTMVQPRAMDADLRFDGPLRELPVTLTYPHDGGSFATAARRCVGVGKCIDTATGVMCPSYMATKREEHSTRGRARLLSEMMRGELITDGWRSEEVREALDLCLACKGCLGECPVNVDMATYKAEFLHHHYKNRIRPASHYSLGWLPALARLAARSPGLVNAATRAPMLSALIKRLGGIAPQREVPRFAEDPLTTRLARRAPDAQQRPQVLLWPDTFTNYFSPQVGTDAAAVLEHAGFQVVLPDGPVCCGLTWISTGQLGVARRVLQRSMRTLAPHLDAGTPVVGLEPSCLAVLRNDVHDLLGGARAQQLSEHSYTFAEFLERHAPDVALPQIQLDSLAQTHCHQSAVMGFGPDERLMRKVGLDNRTLDAGCCGLAGNFGVERGHHEVSVAVAERALLPEIEAAAPRTAILADGFSCRTQIEQLSDRKAVHIAELIAHALRQQHPEREPNDGGELGSGHAPGRATSLDPRGEPGPHTSMPGQRRRQE